MIASKLVSILVMGLLAGPAYQLGYDPNRNFYLVPDCNPKLKVNTEDCKQALKRIQYEPDGTLDKKESHVERAFGTCVVVFDRARSASPVALIQGQIEKCFGDIFSACVGVAGSVPISSIPGVLFKVRPRGSNPIYEDDFQSNMPVCGQPIVKDDCLKAYDGLLVDQSGRFSNDGKNPTNVVKKTQGRCLVEIFTSDGTVITLTKSTLKLTFQQMLDDCKGKAATMIVATGSAGINGRLFLRTRISPGK